MNLRRIIRVYDDLSPNQRTLVDMARRIPPGYWMSWGDLGKHMREEMHGLIVGTILLEVDPALFPQHRLRAQDGFYNSPEYVEGNDGIDFLAPAFDALLREEGCRVVNRQADLGCRIQFLPREAP